MMTDGLPEVTASAMVRVVEWVGRLHAFDLADVSDVTRYLLPRARRGIGDAKYLLRGQHLHGKCEGADDPVALVASDLNAPGARFIEVDISLIDACSAASFVSPVPSSMV